MDTESIGALIDRMTVTRRNSAALCAQSRDVVDWSRVVRGRGRAYAHQHRATWILGRIRRRLRDGRLPYDRTATIFGAPGAGGHCDACDGLRTRSQLIMTVQSPSGGATARLHADCFILWEQLRQPPKKENARQAAGVAPW